MADQIIILPDDSGNTGKQLDTSQLTVNSQTVQRERMNIADPTGDVKIAAVTNSGPTTEYGLVTRAAGTTKVQQTDGTNSETTLFDADSGAGTQYVQGVSLRKAASGGSVEAGTASDPLRTDPTGTTAQPVTDNSGSLTVDNAALSVTGGGVEATALRVTIASDSTGVLSIDDNSGSLTVDGTVAVSSISTSVTPGTAAANLGKAEDATHSSGDTGVMMLAVRESSATDLSSGNTNGDYEPLQVDASGKLWTNAEVTVALPAGTNAIGKLAANSGVDIGDVTINNSTGASAVNIQDGGNTITVDGTVTANAGSGPWPVTDNSGSLTTDFAGQATISSTAVVRVAIFDDADAQITSFGGGTQYTEDAAAAANPVGNATILVRQDTPAGLTTADGDNVAQRGTNYGAAFCQILDSSGNFIDTFGGSGGTAQNDDTAFTATTTAQTPVGGFYHSTIDTVTDGHAAAMAITANRGLHVNLRNSSGVEITALPVTDNGGALTVDNGGTFAVQSTLQTGTNSVGKISDITTSVVPGTAATNLGKAEDAAHSSGDTGVMLLAVRESTATDLSSGNTNGDYEPLQVDANGRLWTTTNIDQMNGVAVTMGNGASGTGVQRVTIASDSTGNIATIGTSVTPGTAAGNLGKAEDATHTSADVGVMALGVRNDAMSSPTSADGDYGFIAVDSLGRVQTTHAPAAAMKRGTATTTGTSDTSLVAASGSGSLKTYITSVQLANTGSTTSLITFKDGSGGSTLGYSIAPAGGGSNIVFTTPLVTSANTAFYFAAGSSSTTIYASAQGYYAP